MAVLQQALLVPDATAVPTIFTTLYQKTFTSTANWAGQAVVLVTPQVISGFATFRITVSNGSDASATITDIYLGEISGTYSFGAAPTQVTWGGGSATSFAFTAANQVIVSNDISYTPSVSGNKLGIAFHVASNNSTLRIVDNNGIGWAAYKKTSGSTDSSTQSKSGYSSGGTQRTALVTMVEAK